MALACRVSTFGLRFCVRFVAGLSPKTDGFRPGGTAQTGNSKRSLHRSVPTLAKLKKEQKQKRPTDDVYLANLYDVEVHDLEKALSTLKRYMELDFEEKDSPVRLVLDLHLAPKGRGKFQSFWQIADPIHKFPHSNRVCVFTDNSSTIQQCFDYGAFYVGGQDVIQKVLYGKEQCDAYVATQDFFKAYLQNNAELKRVIGKLLPSRSRGINEDLVAELIEMKEGMLIHNQREDNTKSEIVVGIIEQSVSELKDNVTQVLEIVRKEQNRKHPPIIKAASVSCCEESLAFELEEEED